MTDRIVSELVIDADTSGADKYAQAMEGAAQVGANTLKSTITAVAGIGAAFAGLRVFVDQIAGINKQFVDTGENARNASMSVREFQETLYAAKTRGLTEKDFVSGLDKIGADLIQASRGVTEFSKLFEVNGLSIRNAHGELKTTKEALADISNLMRNAGNPQIEQAIARMVGLSKDWIPFLRDGTDEIERTKSSAAALGIIVDDDVIKKAADFDREWKAATAAWDQQFRASLASVMPFLVQAAGLAKTILDAANSAASFAKSPITPIEDQSASDIERRIAKVEELRKKMADLKEAQDALAWSTTPDAPKFSLLTQMGLANKNVLNEMQLRNQKSLLLGDDAADLQTADDILAKLKLLVFWKKQVIDLPSVGDINPASFGGKETKLPQVDTGKDQLDRAIEQLEKHTARVEADTMAQGLGAQALAEYRAEQALTTAAMQAGIEVTPKLKDKFQDLAQDAGEAALALEKAKVASNIDFANKTRFLSQEDVSIARELRGIYGNDVPAALASAEAAQIRLNNAFADARNTVRGFAGDLLSGLMNGKSFMDSLSSAAKNLSVSLANKSLDSLMSGNFVMAGVQAAGSFISSLFGGNSKKKEEEERARQAELQAQAAAAQRTQQYNDRAALAGIDQSTLQGQLAAFDIQANQQRLAEAQQGNRAIVALENALGKERQAIIDKANAAIVKSMNDFLASVKTGANSILSPEDQLKYQQDLFASQFAAAKGGDSDALNKITSTASALLDLAKSFYASSDSYTAIYRQVTDSIAALAANASPLSGMAMGGLVGQFEAGGMVGNGHWGVDSVLARYAGGGNIALAGGEYVTRASSVNATTRRALDYVNRTGSLPPANTGYNDNKEVVRVLADGFNGQTTRLSDKLDLVVDRIRRLEDATRQGANLRRVPGTKMAA